MKWYYQFYTKYPANTGDGPMYALTKEIVDTTANGFRIVRVTKLFKTISRTSTEYLYASDGKFYITGSPSFSSLTDPLYDAKFKNDSSIMYTSYHPFRTSLFGVETNALTKTSLIPLKGYKETQSYTTTQEFGVVRHSITATAFSSPIQDDSTILIGVFKNGVVYGDTMLTSQPLGVPVLLSPSNGSIAVPVPGTFKWNTTVGAVSYRIQISPVSDFSTTEVDDPEPQDVSIVISGLNYSTNYYWRVQAVGPSNRRAWSQTWSFTTVQKPLPEIALVSPIHGTLDASQTPSFSWKVMSLAKEYTLEIFGDSTLQKKITQMTGPGISANVVGLNAGTKYYWRVTGMGDEGIKFFSKIWCFTTKPHESKPSNFALFQNFPNPFNPSTTISYDVPASEFVSLKVYDVLGREAAVLVNEVMQPGRYSVAFTGPGLPSGMYIYRLASGSFTQARKMMIVK